MLPTDGWFYLKTVIFWVTPLSRCYDELQGKQVHVAKHTSRKDYQNPMNSSQETTKAASSHRSLHKNALLQEKPRRNELHIHFCICRFDYQLLFYRLMWGFFSCLIMFCCVATIGVFCYCCSIIRKRNYTPRPGLSKSNYQKLMWQTWRGVELLWNTGSSNTDKAFVFRMHLELATWLDKTRKWTATDIRRHIT